MPPGGAAPAHARLLFLRQINNYLTVPAHKLDSPTMSRARIGSGKAGHGGLVRGLAAGRSGPLSLRDKAPAGTGLREPVGRAGFPFTDLLPSPELLPPQVELGDGPAALPRDREVPHGADGGSCVPGREAGGVCITGITNAGRKLEQAFSQGWGPGAQRCLWKEP